MCIRKVPSAIMPPKEKHDVLVHHRGSPVTCPRRPPRGRHTAPRLGHEIELVKIRPIRAVIPPEHPM